MGERGERGQAAAVVSLQKIEFFLFIIFSQKLKLTIYAPVNFTAPCVMFFMRASTLRVGLGPASRLFWAPWTRTSVESSAIWVPKH